MKGPVLQRLRLGTPKNNFFKKSLENCGKSLYSPRSVFGESLLPEPLGEPSHVAVAVDGVGDQVEGAEGAEGLERACAERTKNMKLCVRRRIGKPGKRPPPPKN